MDSLTHSLCGVDYVAVRCGPVAMKWSPRVSPGPHQSRRSA